jgi:hypothetical protein
LFAALFFFKAFFGGQEFSGNEVAIFFDVCFMKVKSFGEKKPIQTRVKQAKNILMGPQGVGFACWYFDVISTIST